VKDFRLALVQHASPFGAREKNMEATIAFVRRAKKRGAALVCLPELGITGHAGHPAMVEEAEPVPEGSCAQRLLALARDLDIHICAGICEVERGVHYNTQFVVGPDGYLGKQRKVHLSADEYFHFRGGAGIPVFELPFAVVGIIICYDNGFPEYARTLAVKGAELILSPHAARFGKWPRDVVGRRAAVKRRKEHWTMVHRCRAWENGVYVGLCDAVGRSAIGLKGVEANHAGGCMVVDPNGDVIAESKTRGIRDEMIVVELKGDAVAARRRSRCFGLQTRRPEVFRALTEPTV